MSDEGNPHSLALILTPEQRIKLESFTRGGGYELIRHIIGRAPPPRHLDPGVEREADRTLREGRERALEIVELLLEVAKRVWLFQIRAEEAVIKHDHREEAIAKLARAPTDDDLANKLCRAWYDAGGVLEAIENGIGTVSLDWRRDVWRVVAEVAEAHFNHAGSFIKNQRSYHMTNVPTTSIVPGTTVAIPLGASHNERMSNGLNKTFERVDGNTLRVTEEFWGKP